MGGDGAGWDEYPGATRMEERAAATFCKVVSRVRLAFPQTPIPTFPQRV